MSKRPAYVLLSSYNGEKYIKYQIKSLLNQTYKNIKIFIRDDGSSDSTLKILKNFKNKFENITIFYGENIGVIRSFFFLLNSIPEDAEYICFCDQDDTWDKNKVLKGINAIDKCNSKKPVMYCSSLNVVDENSNHLYTKHLVKKKTSFKNSLVENIATGCTIMINKPAYSLLKKKTPDYKKIIMHDWWIYLTISAFGHVIYDKTPMVSYRQHSNNVVGISTGFRFWYERYQRFISTDNNKISSQINEFNKLYYGILDKNKKRLLLNFFLAMDSKNIFKRVHLVLKLKIFRQDLIDDIIFRFLLILKKL